MRDSLKRCVMRSIKYTHSGLHRLPRIYDDDNRISMLNATTMTTSDSFCISCSIEVFFNLHHSQTETPSGKSKNESATTDMDVIFIEIRV